MLSIRIHTTPIALAVKRLANASNHTEILPAGIAPVYLDESDKSIAETLIDACQTGHKVYTSITFDIGRTIERISGKTASSSARIKFSPRVTH